MPSCNAGSSTECTLQEQQNSTFKTVCRNQLTFVDVLCFQSNLLSMSPLLLWLVRTSQCVVPWLCFHVRRVRSLARPATVLLVWARVLLQLSTTWFLALALISRLRLRGVLNNSRPLVLPSVGILPLWDLMHLLRNVTRFLELAPATPLPSRGGQAVTRASLCQFSPLVHCAAMSDEHHSVSHAARRHTLQVAPRADDTSLHRGLLRPLCPVVDPGAVSEDNQSVSHASTRLSSPAAGCADKQVAPQDWSHHPVSFNLASVDA